LQPLLKLKIKPPPIQWSPVAGCGLTASIGAYLGTIDSQVATSTALIFATTISTIIFLVAICSGSIQLKTKLLSIGMIPMFYAASDFIKPPNAWVLEAKNDVCELSLVVKNNPTVSPRTRGVMSKFDYREWTTWCYANATPKIENPTPHVQPTTIGVAFLEPYTLHKGDTLRCVGWLQESTTLSGKYTFYVLSVLDHQTSNGLFKLKNKIQNSTQHNLLTSLSVPQKRLANALFFGVRDQGWTQLSTVFQQAGMSHILAISGLHVGLVLLIVLMVCTRTGSRQFWKTAIIMIIALFILLIVELRTPILRAVFMMVTFSIIKLFGVRCKTISLLGMTAIVFLVFDPKIAGTLSFQLSFIVVSSLCVLLPQIQWRVLGPHNPNDKIKTLTIRFVMSMWLTGLCAWVICSPIIAHVFGILAPSGLVSNVPSILLLAATIVCGITKTIVMSISDIFESTINEPLVFSLNSLQQLAHECGTLPLSHISPVSVTWTQALLFLLWCIVWAVCYKKRAFVWLSFCILVFSLVFNNRDSSTTKITTLRVGHGTCHIIQHSNQTVVIDAGSRQNLDIGSTVILPKLRELQVTSIRSLIITHSDLDHVAGIFDILQHYPIGKIVIAPQALQHATAPLKMVLEEAKVRNINIVQGYSGWKEQHGNCNGTIIFPHKEDEYLSPNATSIVFLLNTHGRTILFTGDIHEKRIKELLLANIGKIDVLELPHHGQWSEESQQFVNEKQPAIVIQSTNRARHSNDQWEIPHKTTRFVTAIDGDLTTVIDTNGNLTTTCSSDPATMEPCYFPSQ